MKMHLTDINPYSQKYFDWYQPYILTDMPNEILTDMTNTFDWYGKMFDWYEKKLTDMKKTLDWYGKNHISQTFLTDMVLTTPDEGAGGGHEVAPGPAVVRVRPAVRPKGQVGHEDLLSQKQLARCSRQREQLVLSIVFVGKWGKQEDSSSLISWITHEPYDVNVNSNWDIVAVWQSDRHAYRQTDR